jgi:hypothetical protein
VAAVHETTIGRDCGGAGWRGAKHAAEASKAETREGDAEVRTPVVAVNSVSSVEPTTEPKKKLKPNSSVLDFLGNRSVDDSHKPNF